MTENTATLLRAVIAFVPLLAAGWAAWALSGARDLPEEMLPVIRVKVVKRPRPRWAAYEWSADRRTLIAPHIDRSAFLAERNRDWQEQQERTVRKADLRAQLRGWERSTRTAAAQRTRRAELFATAYGLDDLPTFEALLKRDRPTPEELAEHRRPLVSLCATA